MLTQWLRYLRLVFATPTAPTKLGRWNRLDNVNIKATLANIDSCGDRLCGDVQQTRAVIDKYHRSNDRSNKDD